MVDQRLLCGLAVAPVDPEGDGRMLAAVQRDLFGRNTGSTACEQAIEMWPRRTPDRSAICDFTLSISESCERTCWIRISPAVDSRTPLGSRSKIGTPRSCSIARTGD